MYLERSMDIMLGSNYKDYCESLNHIIADYKDGWVTYLFCLDFFVISA